MKNIKFVRFDWVPGRLEEIPEIDTQINKYLADHPNYKVIDYKFSAFDFKDDYGIDIPAETALIEFEVLK